MNCIIPGPNVKVLAKTLQALSKVGDELYLEAKKDKLTVVTYNLSKTVCAQFDFLESFFSSYEVDEDAFGEASEEKLTCKMHMKVIQPLFRGNLEKKLEYFKLEYLLNSDFLMLKMKYKQDDITMVHKFRLMDSETLSIGITKDSGCNNMCGSSTFFNQLLTMFCLSDDEMTFEVAKTKLIARNYCVGAPLRPNAIRSQVNVSPGDFAIYSIQEETTINFALKPLRTVVHFADAFSLNIGINFDTGGKPLSMIMKNPTFDASFIVATLNPNNDMQSTMTTSSIPSRIIIQRRHSERANITIEDQQAIENENWDEFDFEVNDNNNTTTAAVKDASSDKSSKKASSKSSSSNKTGQKVNNNKSSGKQSNKRGASSSKIGSWNNSFVENVEQAFDALDVGVHANYGNKDRDKTDKMPDKENDKGTKTAKRPDKRFIFNPPPKDSENVNQNENDNDFDNIIPESPESPRTKKAKIVFGRCYDPTFHATLLGEVLAEDSDSD